MNKKIKSKKLDECFHEIPIMKPKKHIKTKKIDVSKKLQDLNFVSKAFFQALMENDVDAALDIIDGYLLAMDKADLSKKGDIAPSTLYHALSKGANPTLKTVAKLLYASRN